MLYPIVIQLIPFPDAVLEVCGPTSNCMNSKSNTRWYCVYSAGLALPSLICFKASTPILYTSDYINIKLLFRFIRSCAAQHLNFPCGNQWRLILSHVVLFFFFTFQYNTAYSTHAIMKLWTGASLRTLFISPVHVIERTSLTFAPTVMKTNKEEMNSLEVQGDTKRNGCFFGCFFSLPLADHLELTALFQRQSLLLSSLHLVFFPPRLPLAVFLLSSRTIQNPLACKTSFSERFGVRGITKRLFCAAGWWISGNSAKRDVSHIFM